MKGLTYFRWWGFSINEGQFPNIHVSWSHWFFIYIALTPRWKWSYLRSPQ